MDIQKLCQKHDLDKSDLPKYMPKLSDKETEALIKKISKAKKEAQSDFKLECNKCSHTVFIINGAKLNTREIMQKIKKLESCPKCKANTSWTIIGLGKYE